ncbi:MAG: hypothetical protein AB7P56_06755 [Nitrososphaeraceae archaeon]
MSSSTIINPKPCNYGCGCRIYWSVADNAYFEVFTKQKHVCKNRSVSKPSGILPQGNTNRPFYYNKFTKQPKPKMSNSLELLTDPIDSIQKKYEILSDLVTEFNGKVHGSQSHVNGNIVSLIVYYEVPEGKRDEVKQRFTNFIKNQLILQRT